VGAKLGLAKLLNEREPGERELSRGGPADVVVQCTTTRRALRHTPETPRDEPASLSNNRPWRSGGDFAVHDGGARGVAHILRWVPLVQTRERQPRSVLPAIAYGLGPWNMAEIIFGLSDTVA
jgi:hypothetical protein